MDAFASKMNDLLVDTFRSILKVEEQMLSKFQNNLSISEMHLIEAIGKNKESGRTISDIANELSITLASVTVAINKLVKKDYVEKVRCSDDGRVVYAKLTKLGRKMDAVHRYFHEQMINKLSTGLTDYEKEVLIKGIDKLNSFFKQNLGED
ncbi:MAG: MarR family transcriptional regulator [Clostridiales bacterium]|nr:MarR family transcriptional regulator [Clostridiales bacterium]